MSNEKYVPLGAAEVSPSDVLREDFMEPMGLSVRELARRMGCVPMRVSDILRGKRGVTAETALMLARALNTSPRFWLNMQATHDLAKAALKHPELV